LPKEKEITMRRESQSNPSLLKLLGTIAVGAVAMYLSDPDRGRRRRAVATDKMRRLASRTGSAIDIASRDLGNRWQGLRVQAGHWFSRRRGALADDEVLVARVRKELGRAVSHPRAIKVTAQQGCVTLHGSVLAHEKQQLLDCVSAVAGISALEDHLEVHETAEHVPSLQGEGRMRNVHASVPHESWSPAMRAVATIGGGALSYYGVTRRTPASVIAAVVGLGLLTRSATNKPLNQLAGQGQAIDLHRSIHIAASPEQVFDVWSKVENFPQFMSNVQEVRDLGDDRSHWVVRGPAGTQVEWDAVTTASVRPELLSWSSTPDSTVQQTGMVRFDPDGDGTRVTVRMSYSPPAGMVGHAAASLFNGNPKRQIEQDLARMKTYIESGVPPRGAAQPASLLQTTASTPQSGATLH
jgi:uncharacterized membrane protein